MSSQYGELWPTSGWDRLTSLGYPCKFQLVSRLGSVTARHCSSRRHPNFAALNRGRHLYSTGRPSGWALAHISSLAYFVTRACRRCHNASELLLVNQSCESYVNHRRLFIVLGCDMVYDILVLIKYFNIRLLLFNILNICLYSVLYFEFSILYFVFYCYLLLSFNFFCFCLACTFETFAIKYYLFTYMVNVVRSRSQVQILPRQRCVTTLGKLFTPMCLCHQAV